MPTVKGVYLNWVKRFMRAAFPEYANRGYKLDLTTRQEFDEVAWGPSMTVTVWKWNSAPPKSSADRAELLTGRLDFHPSGESFHFESPGAGDSALREITEEAAAHPDWTETDLLKALHAVGAEYPFDRGQAFLTRLDIDRFAPVLGKIGKVEVDHVWRRPEAPAIVVIAWRVRMEGVGSDGRVSRYTLTFEPIRGRLLELFREP